MSAPFEDGGPAFATAGFGPFPNGEMVYGQQGMTLRDWFAGQAFAGLLANHECSGSEAEFAGWAYQHADAMITARKPKEAQ